MTDREIDFLLTNILKENSANEFESVPSDAELDAMFTMSARHNKRMDKLFRRARFLEKADNLFGVLSFRPKMAKVTDDPFGVWTADSSKEEGFSMQKLMVICGIVMIMVVATIGYLFTTNGTNIFSPGAAEAREIVVLLENGEEMTQAEIDQALESRNAELAIWNDYFRVFIGDMFDVLFVNEIDGQLFTTNPRAGEGSNFYEASQISIEYTNFYGDLFRKFSSPDAVSHIRRNVMYYSGYNASIDKDGNVVTSPTLTVVYTMGVTVSELGLPLALTIDTYDEIVRRLHVLVAEGAIDVPTSRIFMNNFVFVTWDEMVDGVVGFAYEEYLQRYPALPELGAAYFLKPISHRTQNDLMRILYLVDFNEQEMIEEMARLGMDVSHVGMTFTVAVVYELDGSDLLVYIDVERTRVPDGFEIERINLLGSFGAHERLYFMPDGSITVRFIFPSVTF